MPLRDTADENNFCVFFLVLSNKPAALSFGLFGEQALHLCLCRPACRATAQARVSVGHVPRTCRMFLVPTLLRGNAYMLSRSHAGAWERGDNLGVLVPLWLNYYKNGFNV